MLRENVQKLAVAVSPPQAALHLLGQMAAAGRDHAEAFLRRFVFRHRGHAVRFFGAADVIGIIPDGNLFALIFQRPRSENSAASPRRF
jgi:hypothetical protein